MVSSPLRNSVVAVAALVSIVSVWSQGVAGQAPAKSPAGAASGKAYVPPKTPWGDPDLQGNFTNKYEQGTPFERPAEFDGKRVEDVKGEELADLLKKRQQNAIERAPFLGGDPEGRIGGPAEFRDNNEIVKGGRPWFVTEPSDGKIPPMTPEARQRIAARPRGGSSFTNGPFSGPEELSLYDRCITRGFPGSMLPAIYGDSYQIVQGPGYVAIRYEMIHETRVIPLDNRPHLGKSLGLDMGDARGHWDGQLAGRRDDELQRAERLSQRRPEEAAPRRAFHARGARQARLVRHRGRCDDLDQVVDVCRAVDAER